MVHGDFGFCLVEVMAKPARRWSPRGLDERDVSSGDKFRPTWRRDRAGPASFLLMLLTGHFAQPKGYYRRNDLSDAVTSWHDDALHRRSSGCYNECVSYPQPLCLSGSVLPQHWLCSVYLQLARP